MMLDRVIIPASDRPPVIASKAKQSRARGADASEHARLLHFARNDSARNDNRCQKRTFL